jgi:hypothetical protein
LADGNEATSFDALLVLTGNPKGILLDHMVGRCASSGLRACDHQEKLLTPRQRKRDGFAVRGLGAQNMNLPRNVDWFHDRSS